MTISRRLLALLIVVAGAFALYRFVWIPHDCNVVQGRARRALDAALEEVDTYHAYRAGLRNLAALEKCFAHQPHDEELLLLMGESLEAAGRNTAARDIFCGGLPYNRSSGRLLKACADAQVRTGQHAQAVANYIRLGKYSGPSILRDIPDPHVRLEATRIVGEHHEKLLAATGRGSGVELVTNGDFATAGETGRRMVSSLKGLSPSAARDWETFAPSNAPVTTALVPSVRRRGGAAIRVRVSEGEAGIIQQMPRPKWRLRMNVEAWVFVERGTVCVGSSNGRDFVTTICSSRTGVWEKLETINQSCPGKQISILAGSADGADFRVDHVQARVTYTAPPCER